MVEVRLARRMAAAPSRRAPPSSSSITAESASAAARARSAGDRRSRRDRRVELEAVRAARARRSAASSASSASGAALAVARERVRRPFAGRREVELVVRGLTRRARRTPRSRCAPRAVRRCAGGPAAERGGGRARPRANRRAPASRPTSGCTRTRTPRTAWLRIPGWQVSAAVCTGGDGIVARSLSLPAAPDRPCTIYDGYNEAPREQVKLPTRQKRGGQCDPFKIMKACF